MSAFELDRAVAADAAAVSELAAALEPSLYGRSTYSPADLVGESGECAADAGRRGCGQPRHATGACAPHAPVASG
jgi:hypothetical protein